MEKIDIAPNRKSATVHTSSMLKMGESLMQFRSVTVDELHREWGMVKVAKTDIKTGVRVNAAAMLDPAKFLQSQ